MFKNSEKPEKPVKFLQFNNVKLKFQFVVNMFNQFPQSPHTIVDKIPLIV